MNCEMKLYKVVCEECNWHGTSDQFLRAPNPFDPNDNVLAGGPYCKSANTMRTTCDEPGCFEPDTMGKPTPNGYRRTCHIHDPEKT